MPGTGAVTTYWCDIGTTGIRTSTSAAISAAYMPPQTTTASHSTSPPSVRTPTTRRPCGPSTVANPTTRVCCAIRTPAARAPAASAVHSRAGSIWPSVGVNAAPSTPSVVMSGNRSRASSAEISSSGSPARCAQPCWRRISTSRSGDEASLSDPDSHPPRVQLPVQLHGVHVHPRQRGIGPQLAHQPRRVERGAAGELGPFDEQHVGLAPTGEVVGDAGAAHPAPDDHDPGTVRQLGHDGDLTIFRWPEASPTLAGWPKAEVERLLDAIPPTARHPRTVEELAGGLTNRNLKVTNADGTSIVRLRIEAHDLLGIDREHEYANTVAAATAGVGAPVLHYRPGEGLTVGFLPGRTLSDADLHDPAVLGRVADACRRLHAGPRFANEFDVFAVQARYRRVVADHGFRLPPRYDGFLPAVAAVREALGPRTTRLTVPCHNDLLAENMLDDGTQVRLVDYEYSGNNDPCFELGNIWSEAALPVRAAGRAGRGVLRTPATGPGRPRPAVRPGREVRLDALGVHPGRQQPHGLRLLVVGDGEVRPRRSGVRQ